MFPTTRVLLLTSFVFFVSSFCVYSSLPLPLCFHIPVVSPRTCPSLSNTADTRTRSCLFVLNCPTSLASYSLLLESPLQPSVLPHQSFPPSSNSLPIPFDVPLFTSADITLRRLGSFPYFPLLPCILRHHQRARIPPVIVRTKYVQHKVYCSHFYTPLHLHEDRACLWSSPDPAKCTSTVLAPYLAPSPTVHCP